MNWIACQKCGGWATGIDIGSMETCRTCTLCLLHAWRGIKNNLWWVIVSCCNNQLLEHTYVLDLFFPPAKHSKSRNCYLTVTWLKLKHLYKLWKCLYICEVNIFQKFLKSLKLLPHISSSWVFTQAFTVDLQKEKLSSPSPKSRWPFAARPSPVFSGSETNTSHNAPLSAAGCRSSVCSSLLSSNSWLDARLARGLTGDTPASSLGGAELVHMPTDGVNIKAEV